MKSRVLVTGSNGQLGRCIQKIAGSYSENEFVFTASDVLDITDIEEVSSIFKKGDFDFCINTAAYTNVEESEKKPEMAYSVNAEGVKNIARACKDHDVILIHISTDYVFDGEKDTPYLIDDDVNPINEYGKSKLQGEKYVQELLEHYYIIRTSWLYSEFGHNFYRTIAKKAKEETILYITEEEVGCPTDANNLAKFILDFFVLTQGNYGIYHFTDGEAMSWNSFAHKIIDELGLNVAIESKNYPTFAKRPKYSVLLRNMP